MPPGSLTIRAAVESDAPAIVRFIHGLAAHEGRPDECVVSEADVLAHLFGPRSACDVVIAEQDAQAVGCALFFRYFATFQGVSATYLEDLFVIPERQGHGIGRALLAHVARRALDDGCDRLEWGVVATNETAIGFYQRLGATLAPRATLGGQLEGEALRRVAGSSSAS